MYLFQIQWYYKGKGRGSQADFGEVQNFGKLWETLQNFGKLIKTCFSVWLWVVFLFITTKKKKKKKIKTNKGNEPLVVNCVLYSFVKLWEVFRSSGLFCLFWRGFGGGVGLITKRNAGVFSGVVLVCFGGIKKQYQNFSLYFAFLPTSSAIYPQGLVLPQVLHWSGRCQLSP